jgi:long-chain acyl-CoA synthetase
MATPPTIAAVVDNFMRFGAAPAMVAFGRESSDTWSYGKLATETSQLTRALLGKIKRGETVALFAPSGPQWIIAALATIRAGAVALPIDVQTDDEGLVHILTDSGAPHIFTTRERLERLRTLGLKQHLEPMLLDEMDEFVTRSALRESDDFPQINPDDHAILFYTSGTTGKPKGVPLSHANLAYQVNTIAYEGIVASSDRVLLPLPLHHVYPVVIGMLSPLALGLPIILPHALTGPQISRALRDGQATVLVGVPRLYAALVAGVESRVAARGRLAKAMYKLGFATSRFCRKWLHVRAGRFLLAPLHKQFGNTLRVMASGGALLDPELALALEAFGWQVAIGYGLTETSPLLTINPPGTARLDSVGHPIRGTELRINPVEHAGPNEKPSGEEPRAGEIVARGPGIFSGYLHLPEKTRESFTKDGWFRTGDLGYLDNDNYLHVVGRASTMIKTQGGEKVQPEDLEEAFSKSDAIREIGILEDKGKLVALVVAATPASGEKEKKGQDRDIIQRAIEARSRELPSHQRISDFRLTHDPLPRTRLGKIRRESLVERYRDAGKQSAEGKNQTDRHPIAFEEMSGDDRAMLEDEAVRQVWQSLAERFANQRLTPDTNLQLELGIDSMEWMNLTLDIAQRTGVELEEQAVAGVETIRDLLRAISESSSGGTKFRLEDIFARPEQFLDDRQRHWLEPLGPVQQKIAAAGYFLNRLLVRPKFHLKVTGLEHLPPKPPYIIAPNHASYLDPLVVAASLDNQRLRRLWWTGWTGITFSNPLFRLVSRLTHTVPIEPQHGARSSLAFGAAILRRGDGLVWFPEGGLSPDGHVQPFKPGLGLLLSQFRIPVVPVLIEGTFEAMPTGSRWPRSHQVNVTYGHATDVEELKQQGGSDDPERIMDALRMHVEELRGKPKSHRV